MLVSAFAAIQSWQSFSMDQQAGSASGLFAREIARHVVEWFVTVDTEITAETVTEQLRTT